MSLDLRPPISACFAAFGVAATVTRPPRDDAPITTTGVWITPLTPELPGGMGLQRREIRRVLALRRDQVPTVPRGTIISAPEYAGQTPKTWRVDGYELEEADHHRVIVVLDA